MVTKLDVNRNAEVDKKEMIKLESEKALWDTFRMPQVHTIQHHFSVYLNILTFSTQSEHNFYYLSEANARFFL